MSKTARSVPLPLAQQLRVLFRAMAWCMIFVLLAVRLGSFSEEVFITPVEDAIFDVAFVDADDKGPSSRPLAVKQKGALECALPEIDLSVRPPVADTTPRSPYLPAVSPRDIAAEIFIPPERGADLSATSVRTGSSGEA